MAALSSNTGVVNSLRAIPDQAIAVASITSLLQTLNPQRPYPSNLSSVSLNQFSGHLNPSLVIRVLKNQTDPCHGLFFFTWASNPNPNPNGYSHTHHCFVAMTDLLLKHSLFSTASSLLLQANKLCDFMIGKLVKAHGDRGEIREAIDWFHRAKSIEKGRCLFSYNSLLGVLVRANRISLAKAFYDQIVDEGLVEPDVYTYTTMIRGFCKKGMVENAQKVFDEMRCDPNLITCNTMIGGFCSKGDMKNAARFLRFMMGRKDCLPDTITYTTLINGFCRKGDIDEAIKCFNEMEERGCEPNVLTFNALIHGLGLTGEVEEAKRIVTKMRLNGLNDDVVTHTAILQGLCVVGKLDEAAKYLTSEMVSLGVNPDVKAYGILINEFCKMKKPSEAIALLNEMKWRKLNPGVTIVNVVLKCLCENCDLDRAVLLLKQIPELGCSPNFFSYNVVIRSLCQTRNRTQEIEELVRFMIRDGHELDCALYSSLVKFYSGNPDKAIRILNEALRKNYVISLESFSALIKELSVTGRIEEGEIIFQEMSKMSSMVDVTSYRKVLDDYLYKH